MKSGHFLIVYEFSEGRGDKRGERGERGSRDGGVPSPLRKAWHITSEEA